MNDGKLETFEIDGVRYTELPLPEEGALYPDGVDAFVWDNKIKENRKRRVFAILPHTTGAIYRIVCDDTDIDVFACMALVSEGVKIVRHPTREDVERGCLAKNLKWHQGQPKFVCITEMCEFSQDALIFTVNFRDEPKRAVVSLSDLELVCYLDEIPALKELQCI